MRTATYISDNGQIAAFVDRPPYLFNKIISELGATAQTEQSPGMDGAVTYGVNLNPRIITMRGFVQARGNHNISVKTILDEHKAFLDSCFNPKYFGTLIYNNERGGQIIRARPITTPVYSETTNFQHISLEIEFECDSAYWESYELYEKDLATTVGLWTFPFTLPLRFGEQISEIAVVNPTKTKIEPYFEIYSNSDLITIENLTSGETFTINHSIAEGQTMVINAKTATVTLQENGETISDVSNWVTTDSDFITLLPGKNLLKASNELQSNPMRAKMFYRLPMTGG